MARDHIAVEINLTSNAVILGVSGSDHPLNLYRAAGVPVVLSSDDAGVLRSDLTADYMRAALDQGMDYRDLKLAARTSLEYAFVSGASLWRERQIGVMTGPCEAGLDAGPCRTLQASSDKARLEAQLERAFAIFEGNLSQREDKSTQQ